MNKKDIEDYKVVFEYSYNDQIFDVNNDKHRKIIEAIYDFGIEGYSIYAMNTDTNRISNDLSREFTWLFYLLEKNKSLFLQYCDYLVDNNIINIVLPEDEEIVKNQKKLTDYYNKETYVTVSLQLLDKVFKMNFQPLLKKTNPNECTIEVYSRYFSFRFDIDSAQLDKLGETFKEKLSLPTMLDMVDLPNKIRFECAVPAFCKSMRKNELDIPNLDEVVDLFNYQIGLA